jgi:hypothetical protein
MSVVYSGNRVHDANVVASEATRQVALKSASTQSAIRTADLLHFRTCLSSALANGIQPGIWLEAIKENGFNCGFR